MITVENLHKTLDGMAVLQGATLTISTGEFTALIGSSGGGKSVLLKHMAGLIQPDSGRVLIDGIDLCCMSRSKLRRLRRRFGFVFQNGALFDSMSVYDNVAFPLREKDRMPERSIRERVLSELHQVGLEEAENKLPAHLSGGMVKRAALARALVVEPDIIFFDEPVTGLDPVIGHTILQLIHECQQRIGFTGIIVTHQLRDVFAIVQKVAMLHEGRIHVSGRPNDIMSSTDPVVHNFVTGNIHGLDTKLGGTS